MSKYRKGVAYLRAMRLTDRAADFRTNARMAFFSDKRLFNRPEEVRPVVLVQHGYKKAVGAFMNKEEAMQSLITFVPPRRRNPKHNPKRGQRLTKSDFKKAFRRWKHR